MTKSKAMMFSLAVLASTIFAGDARAAERNLAFYNTHTGERQTVTYWRDGRYDRNGVRESEICCATIAPVM